MSRRMWTCIKNARKQVRRCTGVVPSWISIAVPDWVGPVCRRFGYGARFSAPKRLHVSNQPPPSTPPKHLDSPTSPLNGPSNIRSCLSVHRLVLLQYPSLSFTEPKSPQTGDGPYHPKSHRRGHLQYRICMDQVFLRACVCLTL